MTYLIFGSSALKHWYPDLKREPNDFDVLYCGNKPQITSNHRIEYHNLPANIFDLINKKSISGYVDLATLYVIKLSHSEYNIHWHKTIFDIILIKKLLGIDNLSELDQSYQVIFQELKKHWKTVHKDKKKFSLNKEPENFFTPLVKRKYDHDSLHEYVKYYNRPLYQTILKDGYKVLPDKNKFDNLSFCDKLKLVREENTVITIERYLVNQKEKSSIESCYRKTFQRLVTDMTKGWFPTFMVDNFQKLIKPDEYCLQKMKFFKKELN